MIRLTLEIVDDDGIKRAFVGEDARPWADADAGRLDQRLGDIIADALDAMRRRGVPSDTGLPVQVAAHVAAWQNENRAFAAKSIAKKENAVINAALAYIEAVGALFIKCNSANAK